MQSLSPLLFNLNAAFTSPKKVRIQKSGHGTYSEFKSSKYGNIVAHANLSFDTCQTLGAAPINRPIVQQQGSLEPLFEVQNARTIHLFK